MVIGGSFYATMIAVFGFGIVLFKTQALADYASLSSSHPKADKARKSSYRQLSWHS